MRQANKVVSVLRASPGDELVLFNERVGEYRVRVKSPARGDVEVLGQHERECRFPAQSKQIATRLIVAFPPLKPERTRYLVEKCTELGANSLVPLQTAFGQNLAGRWQPGKVEEWVLGAVEQCGRLEPPSFLRTPQPLRDFLKDRISTPLILGDPRSSQTLTSALNDLKEIRLAEEMALVVGPEGGWSSEEEAEFTSREGLDFKRVTLGPHVLRTETAALVCLSFVSEQLRSLTN